MTAWAVQVYRDGEPVTGAIPMDAWAAADPFAELLARWLGGPISVGNAVSDHLREEREAETLFGHYEKECA